MFRDTPIRLLGYMNEVGESFRPIIPRILVHSTYVIAAGYGLADALDKGHKNYKFTKHHNLSSNTVKITTAGKVIETFLWQSLASVIIPAFVINRIVWFTGKSVNFLAQKNIRPPRAHLYPTIVGLCSIPLIVHPIDSLVNLFVDNTYKPFAHKTMSSYIPPEDLNLLKDI
uniref:Mitochondrial fission process protein 1 n=1 Tax=Arcella intermedia TaxID=1963864 RepID=A0A6B2LMH5_9EUKA